MALPSSLDWFLSAYFFCCIVPSLLPFTFFFGRHHLVSVILFRLCGVALDDDCAGFTCSGVFCNSCYVSQGGVFSARPGHTQATGGEKSRDCRSGWRARSTPPGRPWPAYEGPPRLAAAFQPVALMQPGRVVCHSDGPRSGVPWGPKRRPLRVRSAGPCTTRPHALPAPASPRGPCDAVNPPPGTRPCGCGTAGPLASRPHPPGRPPPARRGPVRSSGRRQRAARTSQRARCQHASPPARGTAAPAAPPARAERAANPPPLLLEGGAAGHGVESVVGRKKKSWPRTRALLWRGGRQTPPSAGGTSRACQRGPWPPQLDLARPG